MSIFLSFLLAIGLWSAAPQQADASDRGPFAITNAQLVTVSNGVVEGGTLVIEDGRITALGTEVDIPAGATVIDAEGKSVYPGMIDSGTRLGVTEVGSISLTQDFNEVGTFNPQMDILTAIHSNSRLIPVNRMAGITTVITEPSGGRISGKAALINLHGYTPSQMHVGDVRLMTLNFPSTGRQGFWDSRSDEEIEREAREAIEEMDKLWDRALQYAEIDSAHAANPDANEAPSYIPKLEAMLPVVRHEMPVMIRVNRAGDIRKALEWIDERGLEHVIFSGLSEGWRVAEELAEAGFPALVGPVVSMPTRQSDRYDRAYENAGLLHDAGVKIALRTGEAANVRNLPFEAGFAAAYGMSKDDALRAVTLAPAEIFGVADELGSLEEGKQASLFIADGDPFEPATEITHLFINGHHVPMESEQTRLYDEFLDRSPGVELHPVD